MTRLPLLERLLITRNPSLVYLHPRAVQQVIGLINSDTCSKGHLLCIYRNIDEQVPALTTLQLGHNNLTILEDVR